MFFYRLFKFSRKNIVQKASIGSILIHLFVVLFFLFFLEKKNIEYYLKVEITKDFRVISKIEKEKIKKKIIKIRKGKKQSIKNNIKVKKLQKPSDRPPSKSSRLIQESQKFIKSFEKILNKKLIKQKSKDYKFSNEVSTQWNLEEKKLSDKKELNEIAQRVNITENIQWKYAIKRIIVYRPKIDYPLYYRQKGIQAKIRLFIKVDRSGNVVHVSVVNSSGYSKLDVIAKRAVFKIIFSENNEQGPSYDEAKIDIYFRLKN